MLAQSGLHIGEGEPCCPCARKQKELSDPGGTVPLAMEILPHYPPPPPRENITNMIPPEYFYVILGGGYSKIAQLPRN